MLGRIRRENITDKLNLYIKNYTKKMFSGYINLDTSPILKTLFFNDNDDLSIDDIYKNFICSSYGPKNKASIFYIENRILYINTLFIHKVYRLHNFYCSMKNKLKTEKSAYIKEVLSWLNLKDSYNEKNWLDYDSTNSGIKINTSLPVQTYKTNLNNESKNNNTMNIKTNDFSELAEFLEQEADKNFNKNDQLTFSTKFKEIVIKYQLDNSFRKDRTPGLNKLNKFLKNNNFNYTIIPAQKEFDDKKITFWNLTKNTSEDDINN